MKHRVKTQKNSHYAAASTCKLKIVYKQIFCIIIIEEEQEHQVPVLAFLLEACVPFEPSTESIFRLLRARDQKFPNQARGERYKACKQVTGYLYLL